jgi:hypothetical protein
MNLSQEALTFARQEVNATLQANLRLDALLSILTTGHAQHGAELAEMISSDEVYTLMRQFMKEVAANTKKLEALLQALANTTPTNTKPGVL